jgi:hypothetical protein
MEVHQSVVRANGDYYSVRVIDVEHSVYGSGGSHSEIEITRLLEQGDGASYQTLRQYTYDSMPSTRVITVSTAKVNEESPGESHDTESIDEAKETLLLFGQFATIDDSGEVAVTCKPVDTNKAEKIMRKHELEKARLFKRIELLKRHRAPRIKKGLLDKILGSFESWTWH